MASREPYEAVKASHANLPAFSPYLPASTLPYLAFALLAATFTLAFYFSTLGKSNRYPLKLALASAASLLGGFGVVTLFCAAGVYV